MYHVQMCVFNRIALGYNSILPIEKTEILNWAQEFVLILTEFSYAYRLLMKNPIYF